MISTSFQDEVWNKFNSIERRLSFAGGGGSYAPSAAQYVVMAVNALLPNERRLQAAEGIILTDGGGGGDADLALDINGLVEDAAIASGDFLAYYDTVAGDHKKVDLDDLGAAIGGAIDHGALLGLADDDHAQYLLHDGTRAMSGNLDLGNNSLVNVDNITNIDASWLGLSAADERIEFYAAGIIGLMGSLVGIGTIDPTWVRAGGAYNAKLLIEGAGAASEESLAIRRVNDTLMPRMATLKARAGPAAVANNDALFIMTFCGHDGTDYNQGAGIVARVDGAVAANTVPTELSFLTTETNSLTERFVITPAGDFDFKAGNLTNMGTGHDAFTDMVANEHINHTGVTLTAGTGLTGGGDISANRTFDVDVGVSDDDIVQVDMAAGLTSGDILRATAAGIESRTDAEILAQLSGDAGAAFDWNDQALTSIGATELYGDIKTDRWLLNNSNTFVGVDVVGAGNLAHGAGEEGYRNSAFGYASLFANTTGYCNSAFGYQSFYSNTTGVYNSAFGFASFRANTTGYQNSAFGYTSLFSNTTGYCNSAFGFTSLRANTTGYRNSAFGWASLFANTTGYQNSAFGYAALHANTTGNHNLAVGNSAGRYQSDGASGLQTPEYSVYIGAETKSGAQGTTVATCDTIVNDTGIDAGDDGTYNAIATTKTEGSGDDALTVNVTIAGGVITVVAVNVAGSGYAVNDTITISGLSGSVPGANDDGTFDVATCGAEGALENEIVIGYNAVGHGSNTVTLGNTSITEVVISGALTLIGTAKVIRDVWIPFNALKAPGTKPATFKEWGISGVWEFSDATDDTVVANIKFPNDMDLSVAPQVCVGWSTATTVITETATWQLEYLYTSPGEDTTAGAQGTITIDSDAIATANGMIIAVFPAMDIPSSTDVCMHLRLKRLGAGGNDDLTDTAELHGLAMYYTSNKLGTAI